MGAFVVAAEAGVPVVPVGVQATRAIMRPDQWFPRHGAVTVTVGEPVAPEGQDWAAALDLRDATRAAVLPLRGEPDLGQG